ncbi:MAG: biotin transporter BioY [Oscillospiraceae bacterium]|nr:biotin transporter BioY [Oscillospiraceae bacterium]
MEQKKQPIRTLDLVYIAVGAALIGICSWISIPMTVPFTLQTFAIFFILVLLGGRRGTASVMVWLLLGAAGVPVFAEFTSGAGVLLGNTGGYMIGFIFIGLIYMTAEHFFGSRLPVQITALLLGLAVCYAFGTAWFTVVYTRAKGAVSIGAVLSWCVLPFILPDIGKLVLALALAKRVAPALQSVKKAQI